MYPTEIRNSISTRTFRYQARVLGGFVALIWLVELVDRVVYFWPLDRYGIMPRTLPGLRGILLAPFMHASFGHLLANTVPFLVLGFLVMWPRTRDFFVVSIITVVVSGLGVWLVAPAGTVHIGASGLVFGYLGFLLTRGYFERSLRTAVIGVFVGLVYSGFIWGIVPQNNGISWQGHLFGLIGGALAAYILARRRQQVGPRIRILD